MSSWTEERSELAKKLWTVDGYSASQIARALGGGVSRNAVIGRLCRMGLTGDGAGARKRAADVGARRVAKAEAIQNRTYLPKPKPALKLAGGGAVFVEAPARDPRVVIPFREEAAGLATILTLGPGMCKWPIGDTQDPAFSFCGCKAVEGRPYCANHVARAFQAIPVGRPKSANELARSLRRYM